MEEKKFEECKIRNNEMICKVDTFLRAMGIEDLHPDKVMEDIELPMLKPEDFPIPKEMEEAQQAMIDEEYRKYVANVDGCIRSFMTSHPIKGVSDVDIDFPKDVIKVKLSNKDDFLTSIRLAMEGYGMFYAGSNKAFIEQTYPKNKDKVIVTHFGWLAKVPEIYGTRSIRRCVED